MAVTRETLDQRRCGAAPLANLLAMAVLQQLALELLSVAERELQEKVRLSLSLS